MSIFEILKSDHQKVSAIFARIDQTRNTDTQDRKLLFIQLKQELSLHADLEEKIFYSELRMYDQTKDFVSHSVKEHNTVRSLLDQISGMSCNSPDWISKVHELKQDVEHHVEEEEVQLFRKARQVLSRELIEEMGISFKIEKDKILQQATGIR